MGGEAIEIKSGDAFNFLARKELTVKLPLGEILVDAIDNDEVIFESIDEQRNDIYRVFDVGRVEGADSVVITIPDVIPGYSYTLTYDCKFDDDGINVAKILMFSQRIFKGEDFKKTYIVHTPFD
ncbi:MAG: hypothetical protein ACFFCW_18390 [Candidatus Hodarchaeota archaeon]